MASYQIGEKVVIEAGTEFDDSGVEIHDRSKVKEVFQTDVSGVVVEIRRNGQLVVEIDDATGLRYPDYLVDEDSII